MRSAHLILFLGHPLAHMLHHGNAQRQPRVIAQGPAGLHDGADLLQFAV